MKRKHEKIESALDIAMEEKQSDTQELSKKKERNIKKWIRLGIILFACILLCLGVYLVLKHTGTLEKFNSAEKIQAFILKGGSWSLLVLFAIQFLQVTFIPLPAMMTTIAGVFIFGPWTTFWVSTLAIILASILAFYLGRVIGDPIINWTVGKDEAKEWKQKLGNGKYVFFLMMLFPVFPDDMLCMVAGVTNMTYKFFIITQLITRPISTFTMCYFSSGHIIPFSGWGIPVWIVLLIACAVLFFLAVKYKEQIENWIVGLGKKISTFFSNKKKKTK